VRSVELILHGVEISVQGAGDFWEVELAEIVEFEDLSLSVGELGEHSRDSSDEGDIHPHDIRLGDLIV